MALGILAGAVLCACQTQEGVAQNPFSVNTEGIETKTQNPSKLGVKLPDGTTVASDGIGANSFNAMRIGFEQGGDPFFNLDSTNSNGPSNEFQLPIGSVKEGQVFQGRTAAGQKFKIKTYKRNADGSTQIDGFEWEVDPSAPTVAFAQLITAYTPVWERMTEAQRDAYIKQLERDAALGNAASGVLLTAVKAYFGIP